MVSKARATRRLRRQCDEHEGIQGQTALSGRVNCDRNVIRRAVFSDDGGHFYAGGGFKVAIGQ